MCVCVGQVAGVQTGPPGSTPAAQAKKNAGAKKVQHILWAFPPSQLAPDLQTIVSALCKLHPWKDCLLRSKSIWSVRFMLNLLRTLMWLLNISTWLAESTHVCVCALASKLERHVPLFVLGSQLQWPHCRRTQALRKNLIPRTTMMRRRVTRSLQRWEAT